MWNVICSSSTEKVQISLSCILTFPVSDCTSLQYPLKYLHSLQLVHALLLKQMCSVSCSVVDPLRENRSSATHNLTSNEMCLLWFSNLLIFELKSPPKCLQRVSSVGSVMQWDRQNTDGLLVFICCCTDPQCSMEKCFEYVDLQPSGWKNKNKNPTTTKMIFMCTFTLPDQ